MSVDLSGSLSGCQFEAFRGGNLRDFRKVHLGIKVPNWGKKGHFERFFKNFGKFGTVFVDIFTPIPNFNCDEYVLL